MDAFLLNEVIKEVVSEMKLSDQQVVLLDKINFPPEIELRGKKKIFKKFLYELLFKAKLAYHDKFHNKIILLTSKFETDREISISITDGGNLAKPLALRERGLENQLVVLSTTIKNEFAGKLEILSATSRGKTIKCILPLSQ